MNGIIIIFCPFCDLIIIGWIRINTNGQSRIFLGRDILPEMEGLVDSLSVSLNAADREQYRAPLIHAGTVTPMQLAITNNGIVAERAGNHRL